MVVVVDGEVSDVGHRHRPAQPGTDRAAVGADHPGPGRPARRPRRGLDPVTSPARTCLDLARSGVPDRVADALRLRKVDQAQLEASLERGRRRPGQTRARTVVQEAATNPWSEAERVAHRALRRASVTGWVANPRMRLTAGRPSRASGSPTGTRHPDIAFDDVKLAVEIDGRSTHDTADAFDNDRIRHNEFVRAGWTVLHFSRDTVLRDPDAFVAEIVAVRARLRGERGLAD